MNLSGMLEKIEMNASQNIKINDGDYVKDGLIMCGKCHTPKQCRVTIAGEIRTPMCLCKCEQERLAEEEKELERQEREMRIKEMKRIGFPDSELSRCTFDVDDHSNEKVSRIAHNYVDHFKEMKKKGKGLLFYGSVGTGKTFISACIANELINQGHPCLVTNFARITNTISGMYEGKQEYLDRLDRFHLMVIDDLSSERDTEYVSEIVQNVIDSRYRSGLPLIITTNLTSEELKHPAEIRKQRIYSRIFEMCVPVEVAGKDRRKAKLISEHEEMTRILGL